MADSSSSWSAPTFGSDSWSAPGFGRGMSCSLSSSWSASGFGRPMGLFASSPAHSTWGSPAPSSSMPFGSATDTYYWTTPAFGVSSTQPSPFGSSDGGDSLQKSIVTSAPVLPMHASSSVAAPGDLNSSGPSSFSLKTQTNFRVPFPVTVEQPSAELQSSTQGLNCTSNPFWLPSTGPQSSFSSAKLQSSTQDGGALFGKAAQTSSATTSTQATRASFCPSSFPASTQRGGNLFNPYYSNSFCAPSIACRENVSCNSAAYTASADTSCAQSSMFSQNLFRTTSTQSEGSFFSPSVAHSAPALSPDVHCTSINVDYSKNTIDLLLPIDIKLVRIRFSSRDDGTGSLASQFPSADHHDAKASATPISFSFYPGENQELTIKSIEQPAKSHTGKQSSSTGGSCPNDQSGCSKASNSAACPPSSGPAESQKENSSDVHQTQRSPLAAPDCKVISECVLPRLYNADYYTVPSIVELAVRESDEPGYCSRVKDFTVGRHGYGSVKFDGETDVRKLDIASIVEFNDREILVYRDESKTPPVGQELNKPAEVTLLNVKCIDQKTVDRYKDILVQWTKEHDAEFVSFDAAKGEWKFRVKHFNQ